MGAILNGMSLVKVRPYGSGFLIFSDYGRPPIRLAALMEIPVIYVFTHDSIGVGEDGPTHQPIEQLRVAAGDPRPDRAPPGRRQRGGRGVEGHHAAAPRAGRPDPDPPGPADARPHQVRPGLRPGPGRLRPGRRRRTASPTCSCWPPAARSRSASRRYEQLKAEGIKARVVSMPSWELFDDQDAGLPRPACCPPAVTARVSVEQASTFGWAQVRRRRRAQHRHAHLRRLGPAEGPAVKKFGFTAEHVVAAAKEQVAWAEAGTHDDRRTSPGVGAERVADRPRFRPRRPGLRQGPRRTRPERAPARPRRADLGGDGDAWPGRTAFRC